MRSFRGTDKNLMTAVIPEPSAQLRSTDYGGHWMSSPPAFFNAYNKEQQGKLGEGEIRIDRLV